MEPKIMISRYLDDLLTEDELRVFNDWLKIDRENVKQFVIASMDVCQISELLSERRVKQIMTTSEEFTEDIVRDAGFGGVELKELVECEEHIGWQSFVDITEDMKERLILKQSRKKNKRKIFSRNNVDEHRVFVIPRVALMVAMIGFVVVTLITVMSHREIERTIDSIVVNVPQVVDEIVVVPDTELVEAGVGVGIARVRRTYDVVRAEEDLKPFSAGDMVLSQYYELKSGLLEIEMVETGAIVLLEGPCKFKILNRNAIKLSSGNLTALVETEKGKGFYVDTPQGRIVDLGTEFGVNVNRLGGTQAMVFDGEVVLENNKSLGKVGGGVNLYKGYHASIRDNGYVDMIGKENTKYNSSHFTRVEKMDRIYRAKNGSEYDQWLLNCEALSKRSGLVYYFNGAMQDQRKSKIYNQAVGSGKVYNELVGNIVGAKWQHGRWGNVTALELKDVDEYVELDLHGRFHELTMVMWVNLLSDRDSKMRALFNTDYWEKPGNLHWQLTDELGVDIGVQDC